MNRRLRHLIADPAEQWSIGTSPRRKRWGVLRRRFPDIGTRVLDLGGTVKHWETSLIQPKSVIAVNPLPESSDIVLDHGCAGRRVRSAPSVRFDFVYPTP